MHSVSAVASGLAQVQSAFSVAPVPVTPTQTGAPTCAGVPGCVSLQWLQRPFGLDPSSKFVVADTPRFYRGQESMKERDNALKLQGAMEAQMSMGVQAPHTALAKISDETTPLVMVSNNSSTYFLFDRLGLNLQTPYGHAVSAAAPGAALAAAGPKPGSPFVTTATYPNGTALVGVAPEACVTAADATRYAPYSLGGQLADQGETESASLFAVPRFPGDVTTLQPGLQYAGGSVGMRNLARYTQAFPPSGTSTTSTPAALPAPWGGIYSARGELSY